MTIDSGKLLAGSILPNTFIPVTIDATILAIPGLLNILHTRIKIIEVISGIHIVAIIAAVRGSGLKFNECPFENGSVKKYTYHVDMYHNVENKEINIPFKPFEFLLFL